MLFRSIHKRGWSYSARKLIEVINGYGMFYFQDVGEGIRSGPYQGAKGFVMNHLGWIAEYYNVYEGSKAKYVFERWAFR